jgi:hypothetical protein
MNVRAILEKKYKSNPNPKFFASEPSSAGKGG